MEKETKQAIRRRILERRSQVPLITLEEKSQVIMNKVLADQAYCFAEHIVVYVDYCNEVRTKGLIEESLKQGKKVYCPKVIGESMEFFQIFSLSDLQIGFKGIWEPKAMVENQFMIDDKKPVEDYVMLMPGVAFTKEGKRLGYGKGFYDRFLAIHLHMRMIAVCLDCQMVDEIPTESTDIRPHRLYTETHQYEIERKGNSYDGFKTIGRTGHIS